MENISSKAPTSHATGREHPMLFHSLRPGVKKLASCHSSNSSAFDPCVVYRVFFMSMSILGPRRSCDDSFLQLNEIVQACGLGVHRRSTGDPQEIQRVHNVTRRHRPRCIWCCRCSVRAATSTPPPQLPEPGIRRIQTDSDCLYKQFAMERSTHF